MRKTDTRRPNTVPQEFEQRVLDVARTARVTSGGRRFNFRVTAVIGDRKGRVGVGLGKGRDVSIAMEKAGRAARKNLVNVFITPDGSIPYEVLGKQTSSNVFLKPAMRGRGIVAGGAVRVVVYLAGYKNLSSKIIGRSTNKTNNALATVKALQSIRYDLVKKTAKEIKNNGSNIEDGEKKSQEVALPHPDKQSKVKNRKLQIKK